MSGEGKRFSEGEKNFEKKLKKPLTNSPNCDIIKMFQGERKRTQPDFFDTLRKKC